MESEDKPKRGPGRPPKPRTYEAVPMTYGVQRVCNGLLAEFYQHIGSGRGLEAHETAESLSKILKEHIKTT